MTKKRRILLSAVLALVLLCGLFFAHPLQEERYTSSYLEWESGNNNLTLFFAKQELPASSVDVTVENGSLVMGGKCSWEDNVKHVTANTGTGAYRYPALSWYPEYADLHDENGFYAESNRLRDPAYHDYISCIIRENGFIVGYVVLRKNVCSTCMPLAIVEFPRIFGLYQPVSEGYVNAAICRIKEEDRREWYGQ